MRIPVYSDQANPAVDSPLCRKGDHYVRALLANGEAVQLDLADLARGVILLPVAERRANNGKTHDEDLPSSGDHGVLSDTESERNADYRRGVWIPAAVRRAHTKVVQYPRVNESCHGAKAVMTMAGCRA